MNFNDIKNPRRVFVIGFMGSDRLGKASELANQLNFQLVDMDAEIVKRDGRSIRRLCMTMGEHEYRNKEYELLQELADQEEIVVACGEGILLDDMNLDVLKKNPVFFVTASEEELWAVAKEDMEIPYAFMAGSRDQTVKEKFCALYSARLPLYNQCIE